jgi:hypothetical protein
VLVLRGAGDPCTLDAHQCIGWISGASPSILYIPVNSTRHVRSAK